MAFTKDSPLVKRVVPTASSEQGARPGGAGDIRGIAIHMAEGGGTASWLTRPDGNSSHYVIEYDGEIVQMVQETHWAGSINPRLLRKDNDPPYTYLGQSIIYGRTPAVAALGLTAANDPNRYVIAFEIEGFAAVGPNARQRASIKALVNDIRRRRGALACVCHRDFQNYKKCPGHKIPWVDYGAHAVKVPYMSIPTPTPTPEVPAVAIKGSTVPEVPTQVHLKTDPADATKSRWLYVWSDHRPDALNTQLKPLRPLLLTRFIDADTYAVAYEPAAGDTNATSTEMFVKVEDIAKTEAVVAPAPPAPVDTTPFSQAQVTAAAKSAASTVAKAATDAAAKF